MPAERNRNSKQNRPEQERDHHDKQRDPQPEQPIFDPQDASLLDWQRAIGNQGIQRALAQGALRTRRSGDLIQAKLTVGAPDDVYEQEADDVAQSVMRMPDAAVQREALPEEEELQMKRIQREALPEEEELQMKRIQRAEVPEEEELQMKRIQRAEIPEEEELQMKRIQRAEVPEEEELQMKRIQRDGVGGVPEVTDDIEGSIEGQRGGGQGLSDSAREFFEPRFGQDFSGVQIHTGKEADTLNRQLDARAFTTGSDIFFRDGEYNPQSSGGQELLAHELTHVVQQGASERPQVNAKADEDSLVQRDEDKDKRSFEQQDIVYQVLDQQKPELPQTNTYWGTVPNALDDSYVKSLGGWWWPPMMSNGIGELGAKMTLVDWRDTIYLNDQFIPELDVQFRFSQQNGDERLTLSPGAANYKPDGGGAMQVIANYTYGGSKTQNGIKYGYHSLLLTFIYSSQTSRSSGVSVEVGAEGKGEGGGVSGKVGATSSTTVTDASLSFTKEIVFRSSNLTPPGILPGSTNG